MRKFSEMKTTVSFVGAIVVIVVLLVIDFIVLDRYLQDTNLVFRVTDLTARQQSRVHHATFILESLRAEQSGSKLNLLKRELAQLALQLEGGNLDIQTRLEEIESQVGDQVDLRALYSVKFALPMRTKSFATDLRTLAQDSAAPISDEPLNNLLKTAHEQLSPALESFTTLTEIRGLQDSQFVRRLALGLLVAMASVLGLLGLVIFRPLAKMLSKQQISNAQADEKFAMQAQSMLHARGQLREQTRRVSSILRTTSDALILLDRSQTVVLQNSAAGRLFGPLGEASSVTDWHYQAQLLDCHTGTSLPLERNPALRAIRGEEIDNMVVSIKRDGQESSFRVFGRPMVDEEKNEIAGAVLIFHDVTEIMKRELDLTLAKSAAESASREKTRFVANISHEIRTPMSAILGYADRLLLTENSPLERQHHVQIIRQNARSLMRLIDDLLDLSRIEAGKLEIRHRSMSVHDSLTEIFWLLETRAKAKGLNFKMRLSTPVPAEIQSDPVRLRQILINVIGNAIKFTERGSVEAIVSFQPKDSRGPLQIEVRDTGCGISEEQVPKLFSAFAQVDNSWTRKYGGTGLGLNISKRLARALGGDLMLKDSKPGVGSTFVLYCQVGEFPSSHAIDKLDLSIQKDEQPKLLFPTTGLQNKRILVVEDGRENRELFAYYLGTAGAHVDTAEDGLKGVDRALECQYDLKRANSLVTNVAPLPMQRMIVLAFLNSVPVELCFWTRSGRCPRTCK